MLNPDGTVEQERSEFYIEGRERSRSRPHSRKRRHKRKMNKKPLSGFEQTYAELARDGNLVPEEKRIDFVLVHEDTPLADVEDKEDKEKLQQQSLERNKFMKLLNKEGFTVQVSHIGQTVFTKLFCPFKRLCCEAEQVKIEMPVKDCQQMEEDPENCISRLVNRYFETDNEEDFISAPFFMNKIDKFEDHENPNNFFRPAIRSLLVNHILININIDALDDDLNPVNPETADCDLESSPQKKNGLRYMLMKKNYTDLFILHEESKRSAERGDSYMPALPDASPREEEWPQDKDPRLGLDDTWTKFFKFQPLWKIRNYFGERIAFYFAWSGTLSTTLWFPLIFGLCVFFYGVGESVNADSSSSNSTSSFQDLFGDFKASFDNNGTPYFGLFLCIWGTVFLEVWKRKRAELAYEWDVEQFESNEPDRPNFSGTKSKKYLSFTLEIVGKSMILGGAKITLTDPVTDEWVWYYPFKRQFLKFWVSFSVLVVMIVLVLISALSVITYRIIISVDYCPNSSAAECLFTGTVLSSVFNAVSILILSKVYNILAKWLTDWENHQTQTRYDDALIFKLFAFQFANNYASCFYIAFFQGDSSLTGFLESDKYQDSCDGSCMTKLSFQVFILMLMKPLPKFFKDVVLVWIKKLWDKHPNCCKCLRSLPCLKCIRCINQVGDVGVEAGDSQVVDPHTRHLMFLRHEHRKPDLGDFTLDEYMEKVIQYGFLMLFGISFPLAPLLALLTNLIDVRVDARRMLWWYRRPIAVIAQDIGMWFDILVFINFAGVISSGFILGFTSSWGSKYDTAGKLIIVLAFEHIVFAIKYIIAYIIPDVPASLQVAIRREQYQILKKMEEQYEDTDFNQLFPGDTSGGKGDRKYMKSGKGLRGMSSGGMEKKEGSNGTYVTYFNAQGYSEAQIPRKRQGGATSQVSASDVNTQTKGTASWEKVEVETSNAPNIRRHSASYRSSSAK